MNTVKVIYERDADGWWVASVPSVPGALTQGRTVEEARRNIRDALGMFPEDGWTPEKAAKADVEDEIRVPARAKDAVAKALRAREEAAAAEARAKESVVAAVRSLTAAPLALSTRDAAAILGLSFQRVHQLGAAEETRPRFGAGKRKPTGRLVSRSSVHARRSRKR